MRQFPPISDQRKAHVPHNNTIQSFFEDKDLFYLPYFLYRVCILFHLIKNEEDWLQRRDKLL